MNTPTSEPSAFVYLNPNEHIEHHFVDGFSTILMGTSVCKVMFFESLGANSEGKEIRNNQFGLTMPTVALAEFCRKFLKHLEDNQKQLAAALADEQNKIFSPQSPP